jgi:predicted short-subunit dehydrogenase-like oxidoreductase (DUF2520 family)
MTKVRIVGAGRAGASLAAALADVGFDVQEPLGRSDDLHAAADDVDVLVLATPDDVLASVARAVYPVSGTVVMHLSGVHGLDVLSPHRRRAGMHPLISLPSAEVGRDRLQSGITFAVAGDPMAREIALRLGGRTINVADADRAAYHAAACIAANHVVALLGQVERVAATVGLDLAPFLALTEAAVADVARLGPAGAVTGPAARGDAATLNLHRAALRPEELPGYNAGVALVEQLVADRRP